MTTLAPSPKFTATNSSGAPLSGGKLYTYTAGTTTPLSTYTDNTGSVTNTNPVILDSRGEANVWLLGSNTYKLVLKDSADNLIWSVDNVTQNTLADLYFLQAGTGAVQRTAQDKMRETLSVKDFGAKGDGVTDDTTAIQACYTYAATLNSATVVWPAADYLVSGISITGTTITTQAYGCRIFLKVLAALNGSPIFRCKAATCNFFGGNLQGQAGFQPADGFNDSFNGGPQGQGRAYRAGIMATSADGCTSLSVRDMVINSTYGAAVASNANVSVNISNCTATSCYFELWYHAGSSAVLNMSATNNYANGLGPGAGVINSYGIFVSTATGSMVTITGNRITSTERASICCVSGGSVNIQNNICNSTSVNNAAGIQIDATATVNRAVIVGNNIFSTGSGILVTGSSLLLGSIVGNQIYTTTGTTAGDGISITQIATANISNNALHDIKRHGLIVSGQTLNFICTGNTMYGQATATSYGLQLNATGGTWPNAVIRNNIFSNFEGAAGGLGMVNFTRSAAFTFTILTFQNNIILAGGGGANKCFSDGGVALFVNGVMTDNVMDGTTNITSTNMRFAQNTILGAQTMPANTVNTDITQTKQTTVGAAGGASAQPATPLGYLLVALNGSNVAVPYHNP